MIEVKLWALGKDEKGNLIADPVDIMNQTETESQLEELLVRSPDLLMPGITLVGRQTPTEGGALDLLGVSEDGNLIVFELKRGILSRDAIAQVIDYASYLSSLDSDNLSEHISRRSGSDGIEKIEDFESWYQERFPNSPDGYSNPPSMVLVGLGIDDRTRRMIDFLSKGGLDISLVTFHAFMKNNELFLARQVETRIPEKKPGQQQKYTKSANLEALKALTVRSGVDKLLESIAAFFRKELPAYEWPSQSGYSYSLIERTERGTPSYRVYVSIYISESHRGQVQLVFQQRAIQAAPHSFEQFLVQHGNRFKKSHGNLQTWIKSEEDWNILSSSIQPVIIGIVEGWKAKTREEDVSRIPRENS